MASFGNSSKLKLSSCDNKLQIILFEAIAVMDFTVLCGHRTREEQQELYEEGLSELQAGHSKHNRLPSHAVDIAPWPIPKDWGEGDEKEKAKFYYLAGIIKGIAFKHDISIRWGGDWDSNDNFNDQTFDDLLHFELL